MFFRFINMKIGLKYFSVSSISSGPGTAGRPLGVRPVRGACRRQRGGFIHHLQESLHLVMVHCQLCSRGRWGLDTSEINWGGVCLLDFLWPGRCINKTSFHSKPPRRLQCSFSLKSLKQSKVHNIRSLDFGHDYFGTLNAGNNN